MISIEPSSQILIYNAAVDMRKAIDGLVLLIVEEIQFKPQDKILYLFRNRACDKFKMIFWDGDGFMLVYKRREKGRFKFPKDINRDYYEIDGDLFDWLRKGFDFYALKFHPELKVSHYY